MSEQTQDALVGTQSGKFEPHPLLVNGHAMTIAGAFWPRKFALPPGEERLFKVEAGTRLLGHCHWQAERRERPTIVLVHGLEGRAIRRICAGSRRRHFAQDSASCG